MCLTHLQEKPIMTSELKNVSLKSALEPALSLYSSWPFWSANDNIVRLSASKFLSTSSILLFDFTKW